MLQAILLLGLGVLVGIPLGAALQRSVDGFMRALDPPGPTPEPPACPSGPQRDPKTGRFVKAG